MQNMAASRLSERYANIAPRVLGDIQTTLTATHGDEEDEQAEERHDGPYRDTQRVPADEVRYPALHPRAHQCTAQEEPQLAPQRATTAAIDDIVGVGDMRGLDGGVAVVVRLLFGDED